MKNKGASLNSCVFRYHYEEIDEEGGRPDGRPGILHHHALRKNKQFYIRGEF